MILGIMSDTHASVRRTRQACELLYKQKPALVLHCGDIGSEAVLVELAQTFGLNGIPVHCVRGNVDLYADELINFPESTGVTVKAESCELEAGDKRLGITHGHIGPLLSQMILSGEFDYVFTGHTHERDDHMEGDTRVINPGAAHNTHQPSCAVLDTDKNELRYLDLD